MDRNTVIGFLLMGAILIGFQVYNAPTEAEIAENKRIQDSIALAEQRIAEENTVQQQPTIVNSIVEDTATLATDSASQAKLDSINTIRTIGKFGNFYKAATGTETTQKLRNKNVEVTLSNKGAAPKKAQLINYTTHDTMPLYVFDERSKFNFSFLNETQIYSDELYFNVVNTTDSSVTYRLNSIVENSYLDITYTLPEDGFVLKTSFTATNLDELLAKNRSEFLIDWDVMVPAKEKGLEVEQAASTVYYKYKDESAEYISERSYEKEDFNSTIEWVSFKQQFFSAALISKSGFSKSDAFAETIETTDPTVVKQMRTTVGLEFPARSNTAEFEWYLGPNKYEILSDLNLGLEDQIDLGWGVFGWVNQYLVIPVFNVLEDLNLSYGIIILLLTIFIKMLLFPVTYKNYLSSAKMRVLKPEIDELNARHEKSEPMKKQQALMSLYRQAGVNPMAGCVPMLLQMPILFAMFRFFPASIELRQQSFLWADDLSSYDSIFELGFSIPFYGDHVSLFTILMAISTFIYTITNTQLTAQAGPQAQQMKIISYFMPVMLLFFFNSYAAGLSYYYLTANVISIGQQWAIRRFFINEDEIHRKIQENKKNPKVAKKSKFQERLEKMAKERGLNPNK